MRIAKHKQTTAKHATVMDLTMCRKHNI